MALPLFQAGAAQRNPMVQGHIRADLGGLADDHTHAVIDEETGAYARAGMDLDAGRPAGDLRNPAGEEPELVGPQPVRDTLDPDGVQPGINQENFQPGASCRVALQHRVDITLHHAEVPSNTSQRARAWVGLQCVCSHRFIFRPLPLGENSEDYSARSAYKGVLR